MNKRIKQNDNSNERESNASIPEPPPINKGEEVTPLLISWINSNTSLSNETKEQTISLIKERDAFGFKKYGIHLKTEDGRNSVEDARQELGDAIQYLFKAKHNGKDVSSLKHSYLVLGHILDLNKNNHPKIQIEIILDDPKYNPVYSTIGASGMDLKAKITESDNLISENKNCKIIAPGARTLIDVGIKVKIPYGYEMQIRSRSGLSTKHGIIVLNSPGTIDCDYRGSIKVLIANFGNQNFVIENEMRIAQAVFAPVFQSDMLVVNEFSKDEMSNQLDKTKIRGDKGFGSTGLI